MQWISLGDDWLAKIITFKLVTAVLALCCTVASYYTMKQLHMLFPAQQVYMQAGLVLYGLP